jgi:hypothetical protein
LAGPYREFGFIWIEGYGFFIWLIYHVGHSRVGSDEHLRVLSKDGKITQNVVNPGILG